MENKSNIPISRFDSVVMWISKILAALSALALGVMMMISVIDVGGRYFFLRPLNGAFELVSMTLVIASTLGVGYCELLKGQIRITVFTDMTKGKLKEAFNILTYFISMIAVGLVSWLAFVRVSENFGVVRAVSDNLAIPYWPFMFLMFIGFAWITIILIIELVKSVGEVIKK
jgi:TRAP-type C4-dicarboxylate transport system permease small subunit